MRLTALSLAAICTVLPVGHDGVAASQQADKPATTTSASPSPSDPFSPTAPPYSVDRVKRELRQLPPTTTVEKRNGLNLEYYIQVFGTAPEFDFFKNFDLKYGVVPFKAPPTHADMLEQMTPQQYRHPVADMSGFLIWLGQKLSKKN